MRKVTTHTISKLLDSKDYNALAELANAWLMKSTSCGAHSHPQEATAVYGESEKLLSRQPEGLVSTQGYAEHPTGIGRRDGCASRPLNYPISGTDKSTQKLQFARQVKVHDSCGKLVAFLLRLRGSM
jgi:hypothetical protein